MRWYVGGIAEAVATSKSKNAIFVVYVEGNDDKSRNLTSLINDVEVSSKMENDTFVALKLEAGSLPHTQFAEIYKNVPVPSIFFIGKIGLPLDVVTDVSNTEALLERIDKVIIAHTGTAPSFAASSQNLIKEEQASQSSSQINVTEQASKPPDVISETNIDIKTETNQNDNQETNPSPPSPETEDTSSQLSKEDKIQRAKELVEKKREDKKLEEQENERQKELERRKLGQEVQKLKEWQKDQELKELMEKRKKEKSDDKAARDRILAQIAQDKADRAARFGTGSTVTTPTENKQDQPKPSAASTPNSARLQFRLPDGSSSTNTFENYTTLLEIRTYIIDNLNLPFRNFNLATTFPRREFTSEDSHSTLLELGLCPTSVILIIPGTASVSLSHQPGGPLGIFWLLLSPIISIYTYVRNLMFGAPPTTRRPSQPDGGKRTAGDSSLDSSQNQTSTKRRVTDTVRRQGNIHRFTDRSDSDDENNTWNGNSTQQM